VGRKVQRLTQLLLVLGVVLWGAFSATRLTPVTATKEGAIDFNRQIRPILSDKCFQCHGPDEGKRMARLRLDTREGAMSRTGVIVPGDAAGSRLIRRVRSTDPATVMPPPESGHRLSGAEIDLLTRWVAEGAVWQEHWAFVAPRAIEPPRPTDPRGSAWIRQPIDAFVWQGLSAQGLSPSPEASRETLLRRVTLDLTGLPPTPAEIQSFLADRSPEAYEKAVDRQLASPRYGEKMALHWLDLARYADTHGFHIDSHRVMWPWRDWLIRSFNRNQPYDQFTVEQLAGDLLPGATVEQKIASGFNRNHMINFEGGAIPEEYLTEYIVDRVEATSTTWLGLTVGCARCHNHKYDPITQKEFYQLYAFFNQVPEKGLDGRDGNAAPYLALAEPSQEERKRALTAAIEERQARVKESVTEPAQLEWERTRLGQRPELPLPAGATVAYFPLDGSLSEASGRDLSGRTILGDPTFGGGMISRAVQLDGQTELAFGREMPFEVREPFTFSFWMRPNLGKVGNYVFEKVEGEGTARRGFEMLIEQTSLIGIQRWGGLLTVRFLGGSSESTLSVRTRQQIRTGQWYHVLLTGDGSGTVAGLRLYLNGEVAPLHTLQGATLGTTANTAELIVGRRQTGRGYNGALDDLRYLRAVLTEPQIAQLAIDHPIQTILSGVTGKRSKEEIERLREHYLTRVAPVELRQAYQEWKDLRQQKADLEKEILTVMVMGESEKPRETFLLARGDYRNRTEKVGAGVPAVLPPLSGGREARDVNRLALARWLVDPSHPLTARVAVNRFWQMLFGQGIVKTVEDFGSQGDPASHPEMLDWLAGEFVRSGWDVKALVRRIVTSSTYRQSSAVTPRLIEVDPENRWLARGPRHRLQAELIRDNALAIGGLLDDRIGGPSVKPYQPGGLWEEMAFGDGFTEQSYVQSKGRDLYRRSLYTFWKRTVPPAALATFDAPDREKCVARRATTNTPLQALILLNDPTYVEAARMLAQRTLLEGGKGTPRRLDHLFLRATGRAPTAEERRVLAALLTQQQERYRRDPASVKALLAVGETPADATLPAADLAAWTMVASAVLNLDETITKE